VDRIHNADLSRLGSKNYTICKPYTGRGRLGRLAAWHLPVELVGPPAKWAARSDIEKGSGTEGGDPEALS